MLTLQNITKRFKAGKTIFSGLNFRFNEGEMIGLIGPNGSGKTTFLRLISVNSFPTEGEVYYGEINVHKTPQKYLKHVGLVHDEESLPVHLSAVELLEWILRSRDLWNSESEPAINKLFDRLALGEDRYQQIGTYSTGMKKKTQIAAAFIVNPSVLIMDEPMRGLDRAARDIVYEMIIEAKKSKAVVLIASHTIDRDSAEFDTIIDFPINE